jgi:hypothetical protein
MGIVIRIEGQSMAAVWLTGTLDIAHTDSPRGVAGYRMKADVVTPLFQALLRRESAQTSVAMGVT